MLHLIKGAVNQSNQTYDRGPVPERSGSAFFTIGNCHVLKVVIFNQAEPKKGCINDSIELKWFSAYNVNI